MSSSSNSNHSSEDSNQEVIEISESHNLLFKLYASLLTNSAVQTGIKQIARISQPIRGKFDTNIVKFTSNVSKWVSQDNIYNQLANLWLSHNFPVTDNIVSLERFSKEFEALKSSKSQETDVALKNFYASMEEAWESIQDASTDGIQNAMLEAVAKAVSKTYNLEGEAFPNAMYTMLKKLIDERKELVARDSFLHYVEISVENDFLNHNQKEIKNACNEYYGFAKRFILIDFPLATKNKDVLKLIATFLQDNSFYYGDSTLNFIEKRLNHFLKLAGLEAEEEADEKNITEKAQRILKKVFTLSTIPIKKAETVFHQVQTTKAYNTMDSYLHINDRIDNAIYLSTFGYNLIKENLLQPSLQAVKVIKDKARSKVTILVQGLDVQLIKRRFNLLHARYEVLQKCVVIVADETVKLVFDKETLAELGEKGKKELMRVYHDLKALETDNLKETGIEYYNTVVKKAKKTYTNARRAVYLKKRENDQDTASAIKPEADREVDSDTFERNTIEAVAAR